VLSLRRLQELIPGVLVQKKDEDECVEEAPEEHCDLTEESNIEETSRSDAQINRQPESNLENETDGSPTDLSSAISSCVQFKCYNIGHMS